MSTEKKNHQEAPEGMKLHMGIAEQGKLYALAGEYKKALLYYRQAIHMSVQAGDPEIFFRHYLECVMECLEQTECYEEVLEYCAKAVQFYSENPPDGEIEQWNIAHIYQKEGVILLKSGDPSGATASLKKALAAAEALGKPTRQTLPLAQNLLRWLQSGLHIDGQRILAEQKRTRYYSVRRDTVTPTRAVKLPNEQILLSQQ